MTIAEFWQVCTSDVPGDELLKNTHLLSLWYDHKGDWEKSHELIQDLNDHKAAAIHAYLHPVSYTHLYTGAVILY